MATDTAEQILSTMLTHLDLEGTITVEEGEEGACLQISSADSQHLIGQKGDRLDDFQYLVNRVLQGVEPDSARVRVDCDNYRRDQEQKLREKVLSYAEEVKADGKPKRLPPLNAYHRRLVHNTLVDDDAVETYSPHGSSRFKKITIQLKR